MFDVRNCSITAIFSPLYPSSTPDTIHPMLRPLLSLLTTLSTLLLLLTTFLLLHSLHPLDTWSLASTSDDQPITTLYLDLTPTRLSLNLWPFSEASPDTLTTILD